jgi:hypothetical protein
MTPVNLKSDQVARMNDETTYRHVEELFAGPCLEPDESTPQQTLCHSVLADQAVTVASYYSPAQH